MVLGFETLGLKFRTDHVNMCVCVCVCVMFFVAVHLRKIFRTPRKFDPVVFGAARSADRRHANGVVSKSKLL